MKPQKAQKAKPQKAQEGTESESLMKRFAALFAALDHTTSTNLKVEAMVDYFRVAPAADAAWAVFFLTGRRLKRAAAGRAIAEWTLAATGLPEWLLTESYAIVGDGAETSTLLLDQLPPLAGESVSLAEWVEQRIMPLREMDPDRQRRTVLGWVQTLTRWERFTLVEDVDRRIAAWRVADAGRSRAGGGLGD